MPSEFYIATLVFNGEYYLTENIVLTSFNIKTINHKITPFRLFSLTHPPTNKSAYAKFLRIDSWIRDSLRRNQNQTRSKTVDISYIPNLRLYKYSLLILSMTRGYIIYRSVGNGRKLQRSYFRKERRPHRSRRRPARSRRQTEVAGRSRSHAEVGGGKDHTEVAQVR